MRGSDGKATGNRSKRVSGRPWRSYGMFMARARFTPSPWSAAGRYRGAISGGLPFRRQKSCLFGNPPDKKYERAFAGTLDKSAFRFNQRYRRAFADFLSISCNGDWRMMEVP